MDRTVKLPLSGDVSQWFRIFDAFNQHGQIGLFNVEVGESSDPALERQLLAQVGSYGRQIGQLTDAVAALVKSHRGEPLDDEDRSAIELFMIQAEIVALVKRKEDIGRARAEAARIRAARKKPG